MMGLYSLDLEKPLEVEFTHYSQPLSRGGIGVTLKGVRRNSLDEYHSELTSFAGDFRTEEEGLDYVRKAVEEENLRRIESKRVRTIRSQVIKKVTVPLNLVLD